MRNKLITILVTVVFSLAITSVVFAEYATTAVYFNIPGDTSFRIAMPSSYSFTDIAGTGEASATATSPSWISFNFSSVPDSWVEPSAGGLFADNQSGTTTPIMLIDNYGNVNETFTMYWNDTPDYTYFNVSVNGTCSPDLGCCSTPLTSATNLTASALQIVTEMDSTCYFNLTMWGFVDPGASGGETGSTNLITNNSAS